MNPLLISRIARMLDLKLARNSRNLFFSPARQFISGSRFFLPSKSSYILSSINPSSIATSRHLSSKTGNTRNIKDVVEVNFAEEVISKIIHYLLKQEFSNLKNSLENKRFLINARDLGQETSKFVEFLNQEALENKSAKDLLEAMNDFRDRKAGVLVIENLTPSLTQSKDNPISSYRAILRLIQMIFKYCNYAAYSSADKDGLESEKAVTLIKANLDEEIDQVYHTDNKVVMRDGVPSSIISAHALFATQVDSDKNVDTSFCSINSIIEELSDEEIASLSKPLYSVASIKSCDPFPIIYKNAGDYYVFFPTGFVGPHLSCGDEEKKEAEKMISLFLNAVSRANKYSVKLDVLNKGDSGPKNIVIFDNEVNVHARKMGAAKESSTNENITRPRPRYVISFTSAKTKEEKDKMI